MNLGVNTFNPAAPPRHVPLLVRMQVRLGGLLSQMGWIFFGFGMVFVWAFGAKADLTSWRHFGGELATANGESTGHEETGASEGGNEHSEGTPIYANSYAFEVDGTTHKGVSYATGRAFEAGTPVEIEFPVGRPEVSRIKGLRCNVFGPLVLFVLIFPLIGLALLINGLRRGGKGIRLLIHGKQAVGTFVSKKPTATRINRRRVYEYTFDFVANNGQTYQAKGRTHTDALSGNDPHTADNVEDGPDDPMHVDNSAGDQRERPGQELLLYDPMDPAYAVMLDALPGRPRIDENGGIRIGGGGRAALVLIAPAMTVIGHGAYLLFGVLS